MLLYLLLAASNFELPPKRLSAELKHAREGKDERAKNTRIVAYSYGACMFAHRMIRFDNEAVYLQSRGTVRHRANRYIVEGQQDKARAARAQMRRAEKLAMRDTSMGIPCDDDAYAALTNCLVHLLDERVGECVNADSYLAMSLLVADFPELSEGAR